MVNLVNYKVQKIYLCIQKLFNNKRESCSVKVEKKKKVFDYSFRTQSSCEGLHEDEVVILNSELATDSLVSNMENYSYICNSLFFNYRHFLGKVKIFLNFLSPKSEHDRRH